MDRPRRRPRPLLVALVAVVAVAAVIIGDRFDDTSRDSFSDPSTPSSPSPSSTPSITPSATASTDLLSNLTTEQNEWFDRCLTPATPLPRCGEAPALRGVTRWFNTDAGRPVRLSDLRGEVVLIDVFAYSCGSCRRDLPVVQRWARTYAGSGLRVVGVQSPHWDFEARPAEVAAALRELDVSFPVALDARRRTSDDYRARFAPTTYLLDATGQVRAVHVGAGDHARTETRIRSLLREARPGRALPEPTDLPRERPDGGGEIGFGSSTARGYRGDPSRLAPGREATYVSTEDVGPGQFGLDGDWTIGPQAAVAGRDARLVVGVVTRRASLVVAGRGTLEVREPGRPDRTIEVTGRAGPVPLLAGREDVAEPVTLVPSRGLRLYAIDLS